MRILLLFVSITILVTSCWDLRTDSDIEGFAPGTWRGVFKLELVFDQIIAKFLPVSVKVQNLTNSILDI